ncbi:hypothetical protein T11_16647 [Trichinella zimbabwensis]|uniref:Uncharacterized protein n=1 Tax=Trichinella zimbabwensis TaxID=268475 RepID=A0A0V1H9I7_9BILA|nr:hypothetical protein T11_16647 [Trichinella zimbabwensis]
MSNVVLISKFAFNSNIAENPISDVRAKILEEVLKLLPGKDGVACNL